jgi:hypothetical protein
MDMPRAVSTLTVASLLMAAFAAACGDATVPDVPPVPAVVEAASPDNVSATVATAVTVSVIVRDAAGAPARGAVVAFQISQGGGSASPTSVTTSGDGTASTSWVLGATAGQNALSATVATLRPVVFTANGTAGPAAALQKVSGDSQAAPPAASLTAPLRVKVVDAHLNAVSGATVSFSVVSGGGSIAVSSATSGSDGIASSAPWILGTGATQTAKASISADSVLFTARADPCAPAALIINKPVSGALATGDCVLLGTRADLYAIALATQQALTVSMSAAFATRVLVSVGGAPLASSDRASDTTRYCVFGPASGDPVADGCHTSSASPAGAPIKFLAAARQTDLAATSTDPKAQGSYVLSVDTTSIGVSGCATVFIERGITTAQQLQSSDCVVDFGNGEMVYYSDDVRIYLAAGSPVFIQMAASFTPWMDVFGPSGAYFGGCAGNQLSDGCTFAVSVSGYYLLGLSSFGEKATGAYTLTVR